MQIYAEIPPPRVKAIKKELFINFRKIIGEAPNDYIPSPCSKCTGDSTLFNCKIIQISIYLQSVKRIIRFSMARTKNIEAFCGFCNAVTKMELSGDSTLNPADNKKWAKCKKCKQTSLIQLEEVEKEIKITEENIDSSEYTTYSPQKSFGVGQSIYHQGWDDFGVVVSKNVLSNGKGSVLVKFQKLGQKQLLETIKQPAEER